MILREGNCKNIPTYTSSNMVDEDALDNSVDDEIMVLQSIYEDKLEIKLDVDTTVLSIMLYPATADDTDSQFVKLLLQLIIPKQYPSVPLTISFKMSRGLSDQHLEQLKEKMNRHVAECDGNSVLFDLIEMAKESLTINNIPSSPCPICLMTFQEYDDILKTECFHYLHSYCMNQYVTHHRNEMQQANSSTKNQNKCHDQNNIPCPVCRESVAFDLESLKKAAKPVNSQPTDMDMSKIKRDAQSMQKTFDHQKKIGGIIDLEAEKNKYLLSSIAQAHAARVSAISTAAVSGNSEEPNQTIEQELNPSTKQSTKPSAKQEKNDQHHQVANAGFHEQNRPNATSRRPNSSRKFHARKWEKRDKFDERKPREQESQQESVNQPNQRAKPAGNRFPFQGKTLPSSHEKQKSKPFENNHSNKRNYYHQNKSYNRKTESKTLYNKHANSNNQHKQANKHQHINAEPKSSANHTSRPHTSEN